MNNIYNRKEYPTLKQALDKRNMVMAELSASPHQEYKIDKSYQERIRKQTPGELRSQELLRQISVLEDRLLNSEKENDSLKKQILALSNALSNQEYKLGIRKIPVTSKEKLMIAYSESIVFQLELAKVEAESAMIQCDFFEKKTKNLSEKLKNLENKNEKIISEKIILSNELETLKQTKLQLTEMNLMLNTQINSSVDKSQNLSERMEEQSRTINNLQSHLNLMISEKENSEILKEKIRSLERENQSLRDRCSQSDAALNQLKNKQKEAKANLSSYLYEMKNKLVNETTEP